VPASFFYLYICLQAFHQSAVQRQWTVSDTPAAISSTDDLDALPMSVISSQQPGWVAITDLQQLIANELHSSAAKRSARLFSGADAPVVEAAMSAWAAQPAMAFVSAPANPDGVGSCTHQSTELEAAPSSSSSSSSSSDVWVDMVDSNGSTVLALQTNPLRSDVLLLEPVEDLSEAQTVAALTAERDEALAAKR
jgi:hypothetical protein